MKYNPEIILKDSDELTELLECCDGMERNYILIMENIKWNRHDYEDLLPFTLFINIYI